MTTRIDKNNNIESELLKQFNNRDSIAFGKLYSMYHKEFCYFASKLFYKTEIDPKDIVQDVFLTLWNSDDLNFPKIINIKAYIYTCIKNKFNRHIQQNECHDRYKQSIDNDVFISYMVESESLSIISQVANLLPKECAKVFELYVDGYSIKEISDKLGKAQSTVYAQKQEAISILKKKYNRQLLELLLIFIR